MRRSILRAMLAEKAINSLGEGRRLIENGGVRVDDLPITDPHFMLEPGEWRIKVGKTCEYIHTVPNTDSGESTSLPPPGEGPTATAPATLSALQAVVGERNKLDALVLHLIDALNQVIEKGDSESRLIAENAMKPENFNHKPAPSLDGSMGQPSDRERIKAALEIIHTHQDDDQRSVGPESTIRMLRELLEGEWGDGSMGAPTKDRDGDSVGSQSLTLNAEILAMLDPANGRIGAYLNSFISECGVQGKGEVARHLFGKFRDEVSRVLKGEAPKGITPPSPSRDMGGET